MGLQDRDQRVMHDFGLLPQILDVKPGKRRRPVERLGDAGDLAQILFPQHRHHAGDLQREAGVDPGLAHQNDLRLAIDVGEIEIVIEAAAAQRVREFARPVRGQHDPRDRPRRDRPEFRDRDLEIGEELQQKRLELLVGAIDFVDQQYRRCLAADRCEQRTLQQIALRKNLRLDFARRWRPNPRAP